MAFTVSSNVNTVMGNVRVWSGYITPDAATGVVKIPGASRIEAILGIGLKSAATENTGNGYAAMMVNQTASGVAANGSLSFSGCTTTKVLNVTVAFS